METALPTGPPQSASRRLARASLALRCAAAAACLLCPGPVSMSAPTAPAPWLMVEIDGLMLKDSYRASTGGSRWVVPVRVVRLKTGKVAVASARPRSAFAGLFAWLRGDGGGLDRESRRALRADKKAWSYWKAQPSSYRTLAARWVRSAPRPEAKARRLDRLVSGCARGRRLRLPEPPAPRRG